MSATGLTGLPATELALAAARAADAAHGPGGPLHGGPFTVKDNLEAAGIPMAIGDPERAGVIPGGDATAVHRLRGAGAILLGKTNCPLYGGGIETDNALAAAIKLEGALGGWRPAPL